MKKILFLIFTFLLISNGYSQSGEWASILYSYSTGPVSPQYQYNYNILLNETGTGKLTYTKSSSTNEYEFTVSKANLSILNDALMNSQVFVVSEDSLESEVNRIGGPEKNLLITRLQYAIQGSKPPTITVPSQINEKYSDNINKLYETIESLVPSDIWDKVNAQ